MPIPIPSTGTTVSNANVRSGAGTNFAIKVTLPGQTKVSVLGESGNWLKVSVNGIDGFIHRSLVLLPTQHVPSGFLIHQPDLLELPLAPATRLAAPPGTGANAASAARIWNKFGGLLEPLSAKIGIDPGVSVAVTAAESGGKGFSADGRMIIRFENHVFWRLWGKNNAASFNARFRFNANKPWTGHLYKAGGTWKTFHGNQEAEWTVFQIARGLNDSAAKSSISMGLPQVMGANHALIGYDSAEEMFDNFSKSEHIQLIGLFDFIQGPHTVSPQVIALQHQNFVNFAALYNGAGKAAQYGAVIQGFLEGFRKLKPA
jgi:hypothetical protein